MRPEKIIACVWVQGHRHYTVHDVLRLYKMVTFWYGPNGDYEFVCLTDRPHAFKDRSECIRVVDIAKQGLPTWWAKMYLFNTSWRDPNQSVIYYDLDTVLVGGQNPLVIRSNKFAICENFTRLVHGKHWPCKYGSCVMLIPAGWGASIWVEFSENRHALMKQAGRYGDQFAIEKLYPNAVLLQNVLPPNFMVGYRDLKRHTKQPEKCSIVIYAGGRSPDKLGPAWIKKIWASYNSKE